MATFTQTISRKASSILQEDILDSRIPDPFPVDVVRQHRYEQSQQNLLVEDVNLNVPSYSFTNRRDHPIPEVFREGRFQDHSSLIENNEEYRSEILPTMMQVQLTCLTVLNDILATHRIVSSNWQPILPIRRHSMPVPSTSSSTTQTNGSSFSTSLHILVSNLRSSAHDQMVQVDSSTDDAVLIDELRRRLSDLAPEFPSHDFSLARAVVSLLSNVNRVATLDRNLFGLLLPSEIPPTNIQCDPVDIYADLKKQFSDLQNRRIELSAGANGTNTSPKQTVEIALLWNKIDMELETVLSLCRDRPDSQFLGQLPPDYDFVADNSLLPPEYEQRTSNDYLKSSPKSQHRRLSYNQSTIMSNEKMRLDLEAVTMAIDRLYLVAPQLHSQRVELKKNKIEELERARLAGPSNVGVEFTQAGKDKVNEEKELDNFLELIGRATNRKLLDQSVVLEGGMSTRLRRAEERDKERREAFVDKLLHHSSSGRLHSQDAVLHQSKVRDPEALLSLPEFIRESVPDHLRKRDPRALLSLPEFVKEPMYVPSSITEKVYKRPSRPSARNRSMSAPPLAWLIPSLSRSSSPLSRTATDELTMATSSKVGLTVRYVAEHHENLQHVIVCLGVEGVIPGIDLEAEVVPFPGSSSEGKELVLKCGTLSSVPLSLPVSVLAGKKDVRVQSGHYEVKIGASSSRIDSYQKQPVLLDAPQLTKLNPTSFICASCSLPLVQSSGKLHYDDLPSEHWSELLEAWVCHQDQKFNDEMAKHTGGFWPRVNQVLVGGSYVIVEQTPVVEANLHNTNSITDNWQRVTCICGAAVGRRQKQSSEKGEIVTYYRFAKYAFRPVSPTAEPIRLPFSSFILADMMEFVQAHATHRFVISDEDNDRPKILLWLFKPHIRLSYATTAQYALPQSASIQAAKVLFKLLGPESTSENLHSILDKYPGFPQAERLSYPVNICRRLGSLLKESNTAYPIGMRVMTGLLVGWLQRS